MESLVRTPGAPDTHTPAFVAEPIRNSPSLSRLLGFESPDTESGPGTLTLNYTLDSSTNTQAESPSASPPALYQPDATCLDGLAPLLRVWLSDSYETAAEPFSQELEPQPSQPDATDQTVHLMAFDPAKHTIVPRIFQAILGPKDVTIADGMWNIGTRSGVIDMQSRLGVADVMYVAFCTSTTTHVYFAREIDAHEGTAPMLWIHGQLGAGNTLFDGKLRVVDARNRVNNVKAVSRSSAFARAGNSTGTLPPEIQTAEAVIARAIDMDDMPSKIISRVLVGRLSHSETFDSGPLPAVQAVMRRPLDYIFLLDDSVRVVNSNFATVREFQHVAAVMHRLRDQMHAGDRTLMKEEAKQLLSNDVVKTLALGLKHANGDSPATAQLSIRCTTEYLQLLAKLVDDELLAPREVWEMFDSDEGYQLTSMTGMRAGFDEPLGEAFIHAMDALVDAGVLLRCIKILLLSRDKLGNRGFMKELWPDRRMNQPPHALKFRQVMFSRKYISESSSFASKFNRRVMVERGLELRHVDSRKPPSQRHVRRQAAAHWLDQLCHRLTHSAMVRMASTACGNHLNKRLTEYTDGEIYEFRSMVTKTVNDAWHQKMPGETPPSRIIDAICEDTMPSYRRALTDARGDCVKAIKQRVLDAYRTFLTRHPDATQDEVESKYEALWRAAFDEYGIALLGTESQSGESARALVVHGSEKASTSAQALKAQQTAAAAFTARSAAAMASASRDAAEQSSSYSQRILEARRKTQQTLKTQTLSAGMGAASWLSDETRRRTLKNAQKQAAQQAAERSYEQATRKTQETATQRARERAAQATLSRVNEASRIAQEKSAREAQQKAAHAATLRAQADATRKATERAREDAQLRAERHADVMARARTIEQRREQTCEQTRVRQEAANQALRELQQRYDRLVAPDYPPLPSGGIGSAHSSQHSIGDLQTGAGRKSPATPS
ncbi:MULTISPECIES: hypothetical protein [Pandoraea]|uniref:hypothetical protein n=1 Tax=Pandoraea TaxID=93217 RepID=UPI001F5D8825|nr:MULTISPECIES: hypothetical protein [Pandoraea]